MFDNIQYKSELYNGDEFNLYTIYYTYPNPLEFFNGEWIDNNYQTILELYQKRASWLYIK